MHQISCFVLQRQLFSSVNVHIPRNLPYRLLVDSRVLFKMTNLPLVYVIGQQGSGCRSVVNAICSDYSRQAGPAPVPWHIDNKYYSADVHLQIARPGDQLSEEQTPEAVVLVVNASVQDSWGPVQTWAEQHPHEDAGVRLLVATHADLLPTHTSPESEQGEQQIAWQGWINDCRDWCAENQYEYVEVSCVDQQLDEQLKLEDGESQGIARVIEALHAHMWPGLTRKPSPNAKTHVTSTATSQQTPAGHHNTTTNASTETQPGKQTHTASAQPNQQQLSQIPADSKSTSLQGSPMEDNGMSAQLEGISYDDDEAEVDAFERLLAEMAEAKTQLANLGDHERRERAAELALKFAAMLAGESEAELSDDD